MRTHFLEILQDLKVAGASIWAEDGNLKFRAPKGALTPELLNELKLNKEPILQYLHTLTPSPGQSAQVQQLHESALSYEQLGMYNAVKLQVASGSMNMVPVFHVHEDIHPVDLNNALDIIVKRHTILRTSFLEKEEGPYQVVRESGLRSFYFYDQQAFTVTEQEQALDTIMRKENFYRFDLATESLIRLTLIKYNSRHHVLLLNLHHIIGDHWSAGILFKELLTVYIALKEGKQFSLPEPGMQYINYAALQLEFFRSDNYRIQLQYWKEQLAGVSDMIALKPAGGGKKISEADRNISRFVLNEELTGLLKQQAKEAGVSTATWLLSVFSALLYKMTGTADFLVGYASSGRHEPHMQQMIGCLVNTLALRVHVKENDSFPELLSNIRDTLYDALIHQHIPFDKLIEEINPRRHYGHLPLVQVLFNMLPGTRETGDTSFRLTPVMTGVIPSMHDLRVDITEHTDNICGEVIINTLLYPVEFADLVAAGYEYLITSLLNAPAGLLKEVPAFPPEMMSVATNMQDHVPDKWQPENGITGIFQKAVKEFPQRTALVWKDNSWTYTRLNEKANQLADYIIKEYGIKKGDFIALAIDQGFHRIVAMLAVMKAGAVYIPLDNSYPVPRIMQVLENTAPALILHDAQWNGNVPGYRQLAVHTTEQVLSGYSKENPDTRVSADDLVYIIHTSGSTGKPKGVMVPYAGVINRLYAFTEDYRVTEDDVFLQKTSYCFDVSVWEIFVPLCAGAKLVLCSKEEIADPSRIVGRIRQEGVTMLHFVPSMYEAFLNALDAGDITGLHTVRSFFCSGEALTPPLVKAHYRKFHAPLYNMYGPTETSIEVTSFLARGDLATVPIGYPLRNTLLMVLDKEHRLLPKYMEGEIAIGGIAVAKGYLHLPETTASRFIPNPYGEGMLYLSGDTGRMIQDGNIEYLGRMDEQVKIRGYRIEPEEIRLVILQFPGIQAAHILTVKEEYGEHRLLACFTAAQTINIELLRKHIKALLPEYMLPSRFIHLEYFPLNLSGKTDKKALLELVAQQEQQAVVEENPEELTAAAEALKEIWKKVLKVTHVSAGDDFFRQGGNSLKAISLIVAVRKALNIHLDLEIFFRYPVFSELAEYLDNAIPEMAPAGITPVSRQEYYPLSHAQKRLWFFHQQHAGEQVYNINMGIRITGKLNVNTLQQAFNKMLQRHEILRTVFIEVAATPCQKILEETSYRITVQNVAEEENLEQIASEYVSGVHLDLSRWPLFDVKIFSGSNNMSVVIFVIHHVIADGTSINIILKEFLENYDLYSNGGNPLLNPLPFQYKDFTAWQERQLELHEQEYLRYWHARFEELPVPLYLPAVANKELTDKGAGFIRKQLSASCIAALQGYAGKERTSFFAVLLAGVWVLLNKYSGQDDLVLGTAHAGREAEGLQEQIGCYVNTLPLRLHLPATGTFSDIVSSVNRIMLEAFRYQAYPYDLLLHELSKEHQKNVTSLFNAMVILQNMQQGEWEGGRTKDFIWNSIPLPVVETKFDLLFEFLPNNDTLQLDITFNARKYRCEDTDVLAENLLHIFKQVGSDPDIRLEHIALLNASEHDIDEMNAFLEKMMNF